VARGRSPRRGSGYVYRAESAAASTASAVHERRLAFSESLKQRRADADEVVMNDPHQYEQQVRSSLGLVLTDAFANPPSGSGTAPGYELRTEEGNPVDAFVSDHVVEAGSPIPTASYIVLEVVLPPEEFAASVVIVQPRRIA
jgi:hypothetical protein